MKNSTFSHSSLASIQVLSSIRQHHPALSFLSTTGVSREKMQMKSCFNERNPGATASRKVWVPHSGWQWCYLLDSLSTVRFSMGKHLLMPLEQGRQRTHLTSCIVFFLRSWMLHIGSRMLCPWYHQATPQLGNLMLTRVLSVSFFVHLKTWNIPMPGSDNGFLTSASRSSRKKRKKERKWSQIRKEQNSKMFSCAWIN